MTRVGLVVLFAFTASLHADTRALADLTPDKLVGIWEAIIPPDASGMADGVYRMDMRKAASKSYLAAVIGPAGYCRFICRLVDYQLKDGRVKLHFHSIDTAEATRVYSVRDVFIEGSAVGEGDMGAISGTLKLAKTESYPESSEPVFFKKGLWIRDLQRVSKEAEETIEKHRGEQ